MLSAGKGSFSSGSAGGASGSAAAFFLSGFGAFGALAGLGAAFLASFCSSLTSFFSLVPWASASCLSQALNSLEPWARVAQDAPSIALEWAGAS